MFIICIFIYNLSLTPKLQKKLQTQFPSLFFYILTKFKTFETQWTSHMLLDANSHSPTYYVIENLFTIYDTTQSFPRNGDAHSLQTIAHNFPHKLKMCLVTNFPQFEHKLLIHNLLPNLSNSIFKLKCTNTKLP
jgi:hypothetical protein